MRMWHRIFEHDPSTATHHLQFSQNSSQICYIVDDLQSDYGTREKSKAVLITEKELEMHISANEARISRNK